MDMRGNNPLTVFPLISPRGGLSNFVALLFGGCHLKKGSPYFKVREIICRKYIVLNIPKH